MIVTIYTMFMSILCCDIFTIILYLLFTRTRFVVKFSVCPLLVLIVLSILRLVFTVEFPNTPILRSETIYPAVMKVLESTPLIHLSDKLSFPLYELLIFLWISGSLFSLFRLCFQEFRFQRLLAKEPSSSNERVYSVLEEISEGKADKLRVVESSLINTPMIAGFLHPTIYLPKISFSDSELYHVLSHEWTHYLHKDVWTKFLVRILCAIYWWNPVVYLLKHSIDNILETKSDLYVTNKMQEEESIGYLEALLSVTRKIQAKSPVTSPVAVGLVPGKKKHQLEQRVHFVLEKKTSDRKLKACSILLSLVMLATFAGSYCFILQPHSDPPGLETGEILDITPETAFLTKSKDGVYSLYINNCFFEVLTDTDYLSVEPFNQLTIIEEED